MHHRTHRHAHHDALAPAAQAAPPARPAATCPACPHCASLPSSNSAYQAVRGLPVGWLKVARDVALRGALVYVGMAAYDAATGREDPRRLARAVAGSVGIEGFVLLYTWLTLPRPVGSPGGATPPPEG